MKNVIMPIVCLALSACYNQSGSYGLTDNNAGRNRGYDYADNEHYRGHEHSRYSSYEYKDKGDSNRDRWDNVDYGQ